MINQKRLFFASCLALIATSMAFSIRADIIPALKVDFGFTDHQMGQVAGPGLWGFAVTIVLGSMLVDSLGMGTLMTVAFVAHLLGVVLTIFAQGFTSLYLATLMVGLANGMVEAVTNPLTTTLYPDNKTRYLSLLHAWFPGGMIIGGLSCFALTQMMGLNVPGLSLASLSLGWKVKMALILVPTLGYGFLILGQKFPATERVTTGVTYSAMWKEASRPLFILFAFLMMMTAATELGPDQWVGNLLQNLVGIQGILLLVYTAGLMFVLRSFFTGAFLKVMSPLGILTFASILSCIGLFALSSARTAGAVFLAATIFGVGKTYFWPVMIGVVAERFPKGGALLMGLMGGAGMFAVGWLMAPIMGSVQDHYAVKNLSPEVRELVVSDNGLDEKKVFELTSPAAKAEVEQAKQFSAVMTYRWVAVLPAILTLVFGLLTIYFKAQGGYEAIRLRRETLEAQPSV